MVAVTIPVEARFLRDPEGRVWVKSPSRYGFWARYLEVFSSVKLLARVRDVDHVPAGFDRVDGDCVAVAAVPHYVGPLQYAQTYRKLRRAIRSELDPDSAVILRMPGRMSGLVLRMLEPWRPFGVELVGDPAEVFGKGTSNHPLRILFRYSFTSDVKRALRRAVCVSYVTRGVLQERYPANHTAFVTSYSSVALGADAYGGIKSFEPGRPIRCVTVGSLDQAYKGVDTVIEAIRLCRLSGIPASLTVVGDGRLRSSLEALAEGVGLADSVRFAGQVPAGRGVRDQLDQADVFVMASRTEGLPRAMIEAMARGLPAIGTDVGGIPELLDRDSLIAVNDAAGLASRIRDLATSEHVYAGASERSLRVSRLYSSEELNARRSEMYRHLAAATELWRGALD